MSGNNNTIKSVLDSVIKDHYDDVISGEQVSAEVIELYKTTKSIIDAVVHVFQLHDISLSDANQYLNEYIRDLIAKEASELSMLKSEHRVDNSIDDELF